MTTLRFQAAAAVMCLLVCATAAEAQVIQPPARPLPGLFGDGPPPDPNRTRRELTFDGSLLGGYDDNLLTPGSPVTGLDPSAYAGSSDAGGRLFIGRTARSLELGGRGYVNAYRNIGRTPSYGGTQTLRAQTEVGRRMRLDLNQSLSYTPFFTPGVFATLGPGTPNPEANPSNGLAELHSWVTVLSTSLSRQWTRTITTNAGYTLNDRIYVDGPGYDTRIQVVSAGFAQSMGRTTTFQASYRLSDGDYTLQDGSGRDVVDHAIDAGFQYQRRLSVTRQVTFSGGGGAIYLKSGPIGILQPVPGALERMSWTPSAYGSAQLGLWRSWNLIGEYRRGVSTLQGLSPEPFVTHVASVSAGGSWTRSLEMVVVAAYANGRTGLDIIRDLVGKYDGYTGTVQLRYSLTRELSSIVSFNHYQYFLNAVASLGSGVPPVMHRNSVRVGLTWSLPVYRR